MSRYQHLNAVAIALAMGLTFNTAHAGCANCGSQPAKQGKQDKQKGVSAPLDISTRDDSDFVVVIPAGTDLHLPAGTQLWPAAPVVISDVRVSDLSDEADSHLVLNPAGFSEQDQPWTSSPATTVAQTISKPAPTTDELTLAADVASITTPVKAREEAETLKEDLPPLRITETLTTEASEATILPPLVETIFETEVFNLNANSQSADLPHGLATSSVPGNWMADLVENTENLLDPSSTALRLLETSPREVRVASLTRAVFIPTKTSQLAELEAEAPVPALASRNIDPEELGTKRDFSWLPPFVLIPVIGLFWAERIRRDRAKARFARAMEHSKRVQRMPETTQAFDQPAPAIEQNITGTSITPMTVAPTEPTVKIAAVLTSEAAPSNPLPAIPDIPAAAFAITTVPVAAAKPVQPEFTASVEPNVVQEMATPPELPTLTSTHGTVDNIESATPVSQTTGDTADETVVVEHSATENDPRIGTTTTDWTVVTGVSEHTSPESEETTPEIPDDEHWAVGSPVIPPNAQVMPTKNLRDGDCEEVVDLELEQLAGLLEDANAMRAEWAGFEERSVDFRERWSERDLAKAGASDADSSKDD